MNAESLHKLLSKYRFTLSHEKALQTEISTLLSDNKIKHSREVRLSDKDCIDFLVGNAGIEVKLKGSVMTIYKQCERYCSYPEVGELLLITNRSMGIPKEINGKAVYLLSLGKGWL